MYLDSKRLVGSEGVAGMDVCPFCKWAAPPGKPRDLDNRFACQKCKLVSCQLCHVKDHFPIVSCTLAAKIISDQRRILAEETVAKALIRTCNRCKTPMIRDGGCNTLRCPCGSTMCYVCRRTIPGHSHFKNTGCPLYSNDLVVHADDIARGEAIALRMIEEEEERDKTSSMES